MTVVKYAEEHGKRAAARKFEVATSSVCLWCVQKNELEKMPRKKMARRGKAAAHPDIEKELVNYILESRSAGLAVATAVVRIKAKEIARQRGITDFKASPGWCFRFLRRHNISIRRRTHISQKLPSDYDDKLLSFQKFVIQTRKRLNPPLHLIGNADQTPLTFDIPSNTTLNVKGASTVSVQTTGHEKSRFTVMLCCMADGTKLPPYIVFKRKTRPKGVTFPQGAHVRFQEKGWMDQRLCMDWLNSVWDARPGGQLKKEWSVLVLDAFRCHRDKTFLQKLKRDCKTEVAVIPGGMTSMLQPLDVSVNKPMKCMLRAKWADWMARGDKTYTKGGRMRAPDMPTVTQWVIDCWHDLKPAIIVRSFKKCCISNALDGSEDDVLWEDSKDGNDGDTDDDVDDDDDDVDDDDDDDDDLHYADLLPDSEMRELFRDKPCDTVPDFVGFEHV